MNKLTKAQLIAIIKQFKANEKKLLKRVADLERPAVRMPIDKREWPWADGHITPLPANEWNDK